ncbi:unnamed protein product [Rotaria magnacalcarata]|uniref:Uncharacterized protein n=1 Tax=Rotaria magnacalcarata TaxID=392030 RepID=A0A815Q7R2_9BILA|nr:unnamed protein product [Rotaria magnacalcarata]CAF1459526.1 unnamed protein product [Rotaria magnacalcarata]CAF1921615.1 unnamed protein product [Rotaria magnacalcarata]CAF2098483.1 unnamed protein product [Rotaria magnacalcarata]CAF2112475.1 unnamed protein product [Rotaria magnacalcarata]
MHSFHRKLTAFIFVIILLICSMHGFRINEVGNEINEKNHDNEQDMSAARLRALEQIINRRGLYDPAYSDSWSNYFEKRSLFDPAYSDWANSFKRSDE